MSELKKTLIEWADYTANPMRGRCPHYGTSLCGTYCYAERMRRRFRQPEAYTFRPEVLDAIKRKRKPATIFMGATFDIWALRNPIEHVDQIMETVCESRHHTFIFLTKNPGHMARTLLGVSGAGANTISSWAPHVFWGMSYTGLDSFSRADLDLYYQLPNTFASYEPALGFRRFPPWVLGGIIGAMTGPKAIRPERYYIEQAIEMADKVGQTVFIKDNIYSIYPDLPRRRELPWEVHK